MEHGQSVRSTYSIPTHSRNPVSLQFLILVVLAIAATILSVLVSITVVVRKALDEKRARKRKRLHQTYSSRFAGLLLCDLPAVRVEPRKSSLSKQYDSLLEPTLGDFSRLSPSARRFHRATIRTVFIDFSRDLTGESFERLAYFFDRLSLVDDELEGLQSRSWWIRAEAANTLGRLRAQKAIAPLTAALEDPHGDVRLQATQALVVLIGVEALRTILRISRDLSRWTTIELSVIVARFKNAAVPYLAEALSVPDRSVVIFCIEMLAEIGFVTAVEPLLELAETNRDPEIQAKALEALGRLGDMRSKELLKRFLRHDVEFVRLKAIEAMGRIGGEEALQAVRPALSSPLFEEKLVAARALAATGERGMVVLRSVESESDGVAAAIARQVLEECGALKESV